MDPNDVFFCISRRYENDGWTGWHFLYAIPKKECFPSTSSSFALKLALEIHLFLRGCSSNSGFLRHFVAFQTDLPLESWNVSRINCHVPGCHHRSAPPFAFRLPLDSEWVSRGTHKELGEGSVTKGPLWGWTTTSLRTSVNTYRLPKGWFGNPLTKARLGKVPMNII